MHNQRKYKDRSKLGWRHPWNVAYSKLSYSIPIGCALALLLLGVSIFYPTLLAQRSFASEGVATKSSSTVNPSISLLINNSETENTAISANAAFGRTTYIDNTITVSLTDIESYTLRVTATSEGDSNLKLEGGSMTLAGANGSTGNYIEENTWGFGYGDVDDNDATLNYYTLPNYETTGLNITDGILESAIINNSASFTKKLVFAAKFADGMPAGHYKGAAMLSLAASPKEVAGYGLISSMQDMASSVCTSQPIGTMGQLKDLRDDEKYTIARLDDGNCWMTQNLALNLKAGKALTSADSDVTSSWNPQTTTYPASTPNSTVWNGSYTDVVSQQGDYSKKYGNYYSNCAATAGSCKVTTSTITEVNLTDSICPKGWQLPRLSGEKSYNQLFAALGINVPAYGVTSDTFAKIMNEPYNFVMSGVKYADGSGIDGTYFGAWLGGAVKGPSDNSSSSDLHMKLNTWIANNGGSKKSGLSVRCVAK